MCNAAGRQFLKEAFLRASAIIADAGLHVFLEKFIPRQVRVHKRNQDSMLATIGAIEVYFDASHGTANDEVVDLRPDLKKVVDVLVEPMPAVRTSNPRNSLSAKSWSRDHHPENPELPGATGTRGGKLISHEAVPFEDFR